MDSFWRLPENISTFGADIDRMFFIIAWITGVVFVVVEVLLIYFLIKYRHNPNRKAAYSHGNSRLEILWTAATAIIVVIIGFMSRGLWLDIKDERRFPPPGLEVIITAKQFECNVTYPGADGRIGSTDDFVVRNQLHVPVNTAVHVTLQSEDVIHSFYLPELRLKQDAVPGMQIPAWFEATQTGQYTIGCAELCGLGHYRMKGDMTVHSAEEWASWNAQQIAAAAERGGAVLADAADAEAPAVPPATGVAAADHAHH
jgi:cytochrome c oxidase subunit 2